MQPNLVQTMENNPALMHGGPFANIAHGCNSVMATQTALKLGDYVVTEAGFGADLGAEKFFNIKCRKAGLKPDAVVLVATIKALKMHGGVPKDELDGENVGALKSGLRNLGRHLRNLAQFGVPVVVGVNRYTADTDAEVTAVQEYCAEFGVSAVNCTHWADGGAGAVDLAEKVVELADSGAAQFRTLYTDDLTLWEKAKRIATNIYGADDIIADKKVRAEFSRFEEEGYGRYPICVAKTQYSFSTDPNLLGAPTGHVVPIREVRLAAGAEFIVVICGAIMTMPGLPRRPAADDIGVDDDGRITGLF
jgi:formate--tetrahydrofolate ligase